ncbi:hypothetical protein F1654_09145 [Alkalicaulis satelles]|uniref:Uncharacterized protein n=1 Tax=Alkalicaulis satelles TaxID=2609175 RepID=A0A5M6ZJU9_9PROT|nr:hypothetical protein [Alkalicaulis satelles]KAA5803947.1 hypothetical protein F1654_09145 [Alkalicaulis satelles]
MLALILALTLAGGLPGTEVICTLLAESEQPDGERGPDRLLADCPAGLPEAADIQLAADSALAAISLPLPEPSRRWGPPPHIEIAENLVMVRHEAGWAPALGQILVRAEPLMPVSAVEMGARHMACALALRPDSAGVPVDPEVHCASGRQTRRVSRVTNPAMQDAATRMRLAPVEMLYCLDEQVAVRALVVYRDSSARNSEGQIPISDINALPNLCVTPD